MADKESGSIVNIHDGISIKQAEDLRCELLSAHANLVNALLHAKTDPAVAESYLRCAEPFELVKNRNIIRLYYFYKGIVVAITSLGLAVCFKKGTAMPVIRYARKAGAKRPLRVVPVEDGWLEPASCRMETRGHQA